MRLSSSGLSHEYTLVSPDEAPITRANKKFRSRLPFSTPPLYLLCGKPLSPVGVKHVRLQEIS